MPITICIPVPVCLTYYQWDMVCLNMSFIYQTKLFASIVSIFTMASKLWKYRRGIQNSQIEEGQTTQMKKDNT